MVAMMPDSAIITGRNLDGAEIAMRVTVRALSIISFIVAMELMSVRVQAAEVVALKSGETVELGNLFWVVNCRSLLKGPMTVEILEGPSNVTASIREQKIIPHNQNCAKPVEAGVLLLTAAKDIKVGTQARLVLRVKYPTVDGERQTSRVIDLTLLP
jgi:hypothetical protein